MGCGRRQDAGVNVGATPAGQEVESEIDWEPGNVSWLDQAGCYE